MRYILNETSTGSLTASLNVASALILGEVDLDSYNINGQLILSIDSDIYPSNSSASITKRLESDFDTNMFIKTSDKFDKGNLLLSLVPVSSISRSNALIEFRKICSDVIALDFVCNSFTSTTVSYICVFGYLKETQTLDYNPADEINPVLLADFTMLNPNDLGLS